MSLPIRNRIKVDISNEDFNYEMLNGDIDKVITALITLRDTQADAGVYNISLTVDETWGTMRIFAAGSREATPEELAKIEEQYKADAEQREVNERREYERLKAKFEK